MKLPFDPQTFAVTFRFAAVGFLVLVLTVPFSIVSCVADERKDYRDTAVARVAKTFGSANVWPGRCW